MNAFGKYSVISPKSISANAKMLAKKFRSASELLTAVHESPELIGQIHGIGHEIIDSLQNWFSKKENQQLIVELNELGITLKATQSELATGYNQRINNKEILIMVIKLK